MNKYMVSMILVLIALGAVSYFQKEDTTSFKYQLNAISDSGDNNEKTDDIGNSEQVQKKNVDAAKISVDEKERMLTFCIDTLGVFEKEDYVKQQLDGLDNATKAQKDAWEKIYSYCDGHRSILGQLTKEKQINPYYDQDTGIPYFYTELHEIAQENGKEIAIAEAEKNLFSAERTLRESASQFLLEDEGWIGKMTSLAHVEEKILATKKENIAAALELRKCELNLEDCSVNSLGALRACGYNPDLCGLSLYDSFLRFMSPFEVERVERFLAVLRGL